MVTPEVITPRLKVSMGMALDLSMIITTFNEQYSEVSEKKHWRGLNKAVYFSYQKFSSVFGHTS